ncbi:MAG TPA: SpoIID/LytB domain-containing protein [Holophagaceae bacterium]|nr:SpoIID/LytB domain-containing protein [Holophagaceae bacterium]
MSRAALPALVCLLAASAPLAAQGPQIRVGIDVSANEWIVSLEGGGQVLSRHGKPLMKLRDGEKLRIWWDAKGEVESATEYRIQVGPPVLVKEADALMKRLKDLGEAPERVRVSDGDTWRVLTGRFTRVDEADAILKKLEDSGYEELWVASESRPVKGKKGRALYAVTETFERRALPGDGVRFQPARELTKVEGKGRYRGFIEIFPNAQGRLTVVSQVDLETYLRGVVPKEMGAWEFPALEALKAQAIAARTYAFANLGKRAKEGFDLLDTVSDQVYGGRDGEQSLTDRAVQETSGQVATFNGRPIQALFMANCGGHTVDNAFVFGGDQGYLAAASCYAEKPLTRSLESGQPVCGEPDQPWLNTELLRLASLEGFPVSWLCADALRQPATAAEILPLLKALQRRVGLKETDALKGPLLLNLARALGFAAIAQHQERPQDAAYFGVGALAEPDRSLATFLVRRGITGALAQGGEPTRQHALTVLARLWQELEPLEWGEGTLLMDGQVRRKKGGPEPFPIAPKVVVAEELPGGALRLVGRTEAQVGDRLKWLGNGEGAQVLVRRLDPDGAALDRYNPTAHWRVELGEADLLQKLKDRTGIERIKGLVPTQNDQGRVTELVIIDGGSRPHRFTGMRIRNLLGLKDNVFAFTALGEAPKRRFVFWGRGWGHGVGMCQTGAYGMALEGATYDAILKHYFKGIELTSMN